MNLYAWAWHTHTHTHTQNRSNRRKATGRLREVLRALRGIEAHRRDVRRVKVAPANFIGNWANWGFPNPPLSCYFRLELPSRKGPTLEHKINVFDPTNLFLSHPRWNKMLKQKKRSREIFRHGLWNVFLFFETRKTFEARKRGKLESRGGEGRGGCWIGGNYRYSSVIERLYNCYSTRAYITQRRYLRTALL